MITVKKLADFAGISVRTLHYYDEKGLLKPGKRASNGYRYYDDEAVIILQQILFFRELGFSLEEVKTIITHHDFNIKQALISQKLMLEKKKFRIETLLETVETTLKNRDSANQDDIAGYFKGFSQDDEKEYKDNAFRSWSQSANQEKEFVLSPENNDRFVNLQAEGGKIFKLIYSNMSEGYKSKIIQQQISIWRRWLENFHHYTDEEILAIGRAYSKNRDFFLFFQQYDSSLPVFLTRAIEYHVSQKKKRNR